jgi:SOS response regulatory protein OraA/RecX
VTRDVADRLAVEDAQDEEARALGLARGRSATMSGLPPEVAYRRLVGFLQRRGYGASIAHDAAARALQAKGEPSGPAG